MNAGRFLTMHDEAWGRAGRIKDPGDAGTIRTLVSGRCAIVTATAETRVVGDPQWPGQLLLLAMKTDNGDCTITVTNGYNTAGQTELILSDVGDFVLLLAVESGSSYRWGLIGADGAALTLDSLTLGDSAPILFGDGPDIKMQWDGAKLISAPPTGLWAGAPSPLDPDPFKTITLFDDFLTGVDTGTRWANLDDGGTGTNTYGDQLGGSLNVVTIGTNDDYHAMQSTAECFNLAGRNELWFEARFRAVEGATNEATWWFGLSDNDTTGGMQTAGSGPLPNYDGVLIYKLEGAMAIDAETSNDDTQDVETGLATFVTNTWTRVGFHVSSAATTAICTAYFDVAAGSGALTAHGTTMNITRSGLEPMHAVFGIKSGGSVETLEVDYVKCVQLRTAAS